MKPEVIEGKCYLDRRGEIVGPMQKELDPKAPQIFSFYYIDEDTGEKFTFTKFGRYHYTESDEAAFDLNLSTDISIDEPDGPVAPLEHPKYLKNKNGQVIGPKKQAKPVPAVQLPQPRRRVLNMHHGQASAVAKAPDPWKILSIYEDENTLIALAEVQHVEKLKTCRNGPIQADGLHVVTGLTRRDPTCDMWLNPCFIPEDKAKAFLYQFKRYREDVENPQRIIELVAEEVGKKHSKNTNKPSVNFKHVDAMPGPPNYDTDDWDTSPF